MTDTDKDELASLKARVEELEAKVSPPKSTFVPMSDAEHRDMVHQMREGNMRYAMHPSVIRDLTVLDDNLCAGIRGDARAPTSAQGMIPSSHQPVSGGRASAGDGTGYVEPRPLSPPPGIDLIDRAVNAALPHGPEWGKEKK
jgi:hypothetical protein